jgi:acetate kinase
VSAPAQAAAERQRPWRLPDHPAALDALLEWLQGSEAVSAVGYRIVHGGATYREPQPVTPELLATLKKLIPLAPERLPYQLAAMETIGPRYPSAAQVAGFDTAFHRHMPGVSQVYALPRDPKWEGVIRYGFHGLSCEYIVSELRAQAGDRVAPTSRASTCPLTPTACCRWPTTRCAAGTT